MNLFGCLTIRVADGTAKSIINAAPIDETINEFHVYDQFKYSDWLLIMALITQYIRVPIGRIIDTITIEEQKNRANKFNFPSLIERLFL